MPTDERDVKSNNVQTNSLNAHEPGGKTDIPSRAPAIELIGTARPSDSPNHDLDDSNLPPRGKD